MDVMREETRGGRGRGRGGGMGRRCVGALRLGKYEVGVAHG